MDPRALIPLLLVLPAFAGCLGEDAPAPASEVTSVGTAADAGATAGEAPSAPKEAFAVESGTAHPVVLSTNAARAPVVLDLSGEFTPQDCRPLRFGSFEETLAAASTPSVFHDLSGSLAPGDVFAYEILLTYANTADNWAEIHAAYGLGNTVQEHSESTREMTDVVIAWAGQGMRVSEDDMAWLHVACEYGAMSRPIPYTLTVAISYAEGAIPAEAPLLLPVPEGATQLHVRGMPLDASKGVLSHYRLFGPDDALVCECALSSADEVATIPLPGPGDYVLLVDHTDNGFVSVALDMPASGPLRPLEAQWVRTSLLVAEGGPVDETVAFGVPRVPLAMFAHVMQKEGDAGLGKKTQLVVSNGRGEPLRASWGGHVAWGTPGGSAWLGFWPGDWEFALDHHAYAPGAHTAHVAAEQLRGEIVLVTREYVR